MPQVSLYLDDAVLAGSRAEAANQGVSLSRYVNRVRSSRESRASASKTGGRKLAARASGAQIPADARRQPSTI
jgi:hypothetical protein